MNDLASMVGVPQRVVADLIGAFAHRGWTLAAAESLTGGLFTALLTEVPGSSAVVRGALVVYATDLKHRLAGVDPVLLAERGPVDPQVAAELADGARNRCGATVGIGLTGVAGPDPQGGVPVGTWYCAVSGPGGHRDQRRGVPQADSGASADARGRIRAAALRGALDMLANIPATDS
jgi:nicotinamide-nucleotide amidase